MKAFELIMVLLILGLNSNLLFSQDQSNKNIISLNSDFVSRYVWRGVDFGNAPAIQPSITASIKGFSFGTWGSYSLSSNTGGLEADLFIAYDFDFGLHLGITDYYFPDEKLALVTNSSDSSMALQPIRSGGYFNYKNNHLYELNVFYTIKKISISGNYLIYGNSDDFYFEIACDILPNASLFLGAGNKGYTVKGNFNVTNIGLAVNKEIKVSEGFNMNIFSSALINPNTEQIHLIFGIGI
jgi:hypothetical protein